MKQKYCKARKDFCVHQGAHAAHRKAAKLKICNIQHYYHCDAMKKKKKSQKLYICKISQKQNLIAANTSEGRYFFLDISSFNSIATSWEFFLTISRV